jgi:hypothetical protein
MAGFSAGEEGTTMTDAEPTVTVADILAKAERIYCEFTVLLERLRSATVEAPQVAPAPVDSSELPKDLIEVGAAAALARRAKSTVAAWCRKNVIVGEVGFAVKLGSRWLISKSRFLKHLNVRRAI